MSRALRDQVAEFLKHNENVWIDGRDIAKVGGAYAWRTRLSDCRTQLGMQIENRVRTITRDDGSKYRLSEYKYEPPSEPYQQRLLDSVSGVTAG